MRASVGGKDVMPFQTLIESMADIAVAKDILEVNMAFIFQSFV